MDRSRKLIILISFVALAGISISFVAYNQTQYTSPYDVPFIERTPNVFKLTDVPCSEETGSGFRVSGTDKYGFGWAGCFYNGCEYDESIERDYMKCVAVHLIE